MRAVSRDQAIEFVTRLGKLIEFGALSPTELQRDIGGMEDVELSERITSFLRHGAPRVRRMPKTLRLDKHMPLTRISTSWRYWQGDIGDDGTNGNPHEDIVMRALEELQFSKLSFTTRDGSDPTPFRTRERLKGHVGLPGFTVGVTLLDEWDTQGDDSILEWYHAAWGIEYVTFLGTLIRDGAGDPVFYGLRRDEDATWHMSPTEARGKLLENEFVAIYVP